MSDLVALPGWHPDPLLCARSETPRFLRSNWDGVQAAPFGPWRLADRIEPANGLTAEPLSADEPLIDDELPEEAVLEPSPLLAEDPVQHALSEAAIEAIRASAYAEGLAAGSAEARQEIEAERAQERALIRHLGIEMRALNQDPQRFFEPLKRLALHLAEQLVRGELRASGKVVAELIQQSLAQLEQPADKAVISLHPDDLARLQALGDAAEGMTLAADNTLLPGSVRVRVNDALVEDLIEHRLAPLARRLLDAPDAWLSRSTLLHPDTDGLPGSAPGAPDWQAATIDAEATEEAADKATPADMDITAAEQPPTRPAIVTGYDRGDA